MPRFVIDASLTLAWCFEDEMTTATEALLARLRGRDDATVPQHWAMEIANSLLVAIRRGRITKDKAIRFIVDLRSLPIRVDPARPEAAFEEIFALAERYRLTAYDAAYLELAMREGVPLATLDNDLRDAASAAGIRLA